jgi:hypothetical protein
MHADFNRLLDVEQRRITWNEQRIVVAEIVLRAIDERCIPEGGQQQSPATVLRRHST